MTTLHRHIPSLFLAKRFSIVLYSDMGFSGMTWPWGEASEERGDEADTRRMQGGTGRRKRVGRTLFLSPTQRTPA